MASISIQLATQLCDDDVAKLDLTKAGEGLLKSTLLTRKNLRHSIHRAYDDYRAGVQLLSLAQANSLMRKTNDSLDVLKNLDKTISDGMMMRGYWSDAEFDSNFQACEQYIDTLQILLEEVKLLIASLQASVRSGPPPQGAPPGGNPQKLSLPKLELPTFNGEAEKYNKFITQFESIISKFTITEFEKFSYLERQLRGSAKDLIDSVSINSMDYNTARNLLDKAYLHNSVQQNNVIKRILDLQLDANNPYKWISQARILRDDVISTQITTDIFLRYFFWRSLDEPFRQAIISITGETRQTLASILDKFFDANIRIEDLKKIGTPSVPTSHSNHSNPPQSTIAMATGSSTSSNSQSKQAKNKDPKCVLCSLGHRTVQCDKYKTAKEKVKRLKELKRCEFCMLNNHVSSNCKAKFYQPCPCSGKHLKFLCTQTTTPSAAPPQSPSASSGTPVVANSSCLVVAMPTVAKGTLLPSFTAPIIHSAGTTNCRGFFDTCSCITLIEASFARDLGMKVIESNINLTLKGINENKFIKSERVEFGIQTDNGILKMTALCVPSINIDLQVDEIEKVVSKFRSENYDLADKHLSSSSVSNAKLLLGADFMHLLIDGTGTFGSTEGEKSLYFRSPLGILLGGNVQKLAKDVAYLQPEQKNSI